MKRKALITSTALLLVAIVCLATASYAWFTGVAATSIKTFNFAITQSDSNIQLAAAGWNDQQIGTYKSTLAPENFTGYTFAKVLIPLSTADGTVFYPTAYDNINNVWKSGAANTPSAVQTGLVAFKFFVKSTSDATVTLTYTIGGNDADDFKAAGKVGTQIDDDFDIYHFTPDADDEYQPIIDTGAYAKRNDNPAAPTQFVPAANGAALLASAQEGAAGNVPIDNDEKFGTAVTQDNDDVTFTATAGEPTLVTVYLWYEGQDASCEGSINVSDLTFSVAVA